jgi:hypothetical protein
LGFSARTVKKPLSEAAGNVLFRQDESR